MSDTDILERLRRLHRLRPKPRANPVQSDVPVGGDSAPGAAAHLLASPEEEGEIANDLGTCLRRTLRCPLSLERGGLTLAQAFRWDPGALVSLFPELRLEAEVDLRHVAFLDTETTGLGGAGTFAFLVGVGAFELGPEGQVPRAFRVVQFFARHPGEEAAVLQALADHLEGFALLGTFNGRTFDLPLLRARYALHGRLDGPGPRLPSLLAPDAPHLDLLPPARRLWRRRLGSCALSALERGVLGYRRGQADVPGAQIPLLYMQYLTHGHVQALHGVFYHNAEDIVSMVALLARLGRCLSSASDIPPESPLPSADLLSLARLHEAMGQVDRAERLYRAALDAGPEPQLQAEIFHRLGWLLKRQGRWDEAAGVWQRWIATVPGPDPRPYVELAKLFEWRTRDLAQAEMWTAWALHNQETAPAGRSSPRAIAELRHRLERIRRKRRRNGS